MSAVCLLLAVVAAAPMELAKVPEQRPMAWVAAPDLDALVRDVGASPFKALLSLFVSQKERALLAKTQDAELLAAAYANGEHIVLGKLGQATFPIRGSVVGALSSRGFREKATKDEKRPHRHFQNNRGDDAFVFVEDNRLGVTSSVAWASRGFLPATVPLAAEESFSKFSGAALLAGALSFPRVYTALSKRPNAALVAGNLERLGFLRLSTLTGRGWLEGKRMRSQWRLELGEEPRGLLEVLTPDEQQIAAKRLPKGVTAAARLSVKPAALFHLLMKLLAYNGPIQYGLVSSQLTGIEEQIGLRIDEDILGDTPGALWTLELAKGPLTVMAVRDVKGATKLLQRLGGTLEVMAPELAMIETVVGKTKVWETRGRGGFAMAASQAGLVWGAPEAVRAFLTKPRRFLPKTQPSKTSVASGLLSGGYVGETLGRVLGRPVPARALGITRFDVEAHPGELLLRSQTEPPH